MRMQVLAVTMSEAQISKLTEMARAWGTLKSGKGIDQQQVGKFKSYHPKRDWFVKVN